MSENTGQQANSAPQPISRQLATAAWTVAAVAYCIAFMQRLAPQAMLPDLAVSFQVDATWLGVLASGYFYGYLIMQIPAGILVDAIGIRRVIMISLTVSLIGTFAFASSSSLLGAFSSRLVIACCDALVFTELLKLVATRFSKSRFDWMSGLSKVSGYIGGMLATTPLVMALSGLGWRAPFWAICFVLLAALVLCWSLFPSDVNTVDGQRLIRRRLSATFTLLGQKAKTFRSWACAIFFSSHFLPVTTLSGIWGLPMIRDTLALSTVESSHYILVSYLATSQGRSSWAFIPTK